MDLFLLKFNESGILQWNVTWGDNKQDTRGNIAVDSKGYIYLVGIPEKLYLFFVFL